MANGFHKPLFDTGRHRTMDDDKIRVAGMLPTTSRPQFLLTTHNPAQTTNTTAATAYCLPSALNNTITTVIEDAHWIIVDVQHVRSSNSFTCTDNADQQT